MDNEHRSTGHMSGSHGLSGPMDRNTKLCIIVEVGDRGVPLGTSSCLYFSHFYIFIFTMTRLLEASPELMISLNCFAALELKASQLTQMLLSSINLQPNIWE